MGRKRGPVRIGLSVGTRSLLYGAHCFLIHPWFVAWGWRRLYGFPWDPRLWFVFFCHDIGYWGLAAMDDARGELHPIEGSRIVGALFGSRWAAFTRYHSRFLAKRDGVPFSPLCAADKLAIVLTPWWLYLPMAWATGELAEYRALAQTRTAQGEPKFHASGVPPGHELRQWYADIQLYLREWVAEHRDGRADTWTPAAPREK